MHRARAMSRGLALAFIVMLALCPRKERDGAPRRLSDLTEKEKALGCGILITLIITGALMPFLALSIIVVLLAVMVLGAIVGSRDKRTIRKDDKAFIMILLEGREILHWIIMAALATFVVFTVLAMLRSIPILWGWIAPLGSASVLMLWGAS